MASTDPFRASNYDQSAVWLADAARPHDKNSPSLRLAHSAWNPYQLLRVTLGLLRLFDAERWRNVYTFFPRNFDDRHQRGILTLEKHPWIFAWAQRFTVPGADLVSAQRSLTTVGKPHEYSGVKRRCQGCMSRQFYRQGAAARRRRAGTGILQKCTEFAPDLLRCLTPYALD